MPSLLEVWLTSVGFDLFKPDVCIHTDTGVICDTPIRDPEIFMKTSHFFEKIPGVHTVESVTHESLSLVYRWECGCADLADRNRGILVFSYVDNFEPYTFSGCEGNLAFALRMRFMRDLPPIDSSSWILHENLFLTKLRMLGVFHDLYFSSDTYRRMYTRWVKRYPLGPRRRMDDARANPVMENDTQQFASAACVKYEVLNESGKPLKPRAFFPKSAHNLCRNGPIMYYVKRMISKIFDGLTTPLIFGSGHNNRSLGDAFVRAVEHQKLVLSDLAAIEIDLSMCETTMRGPFLQLEKEIYLNLKIQPRDVKYLLEHAYSYGKSIKRRLAFKMPFCRESGTANTTVGNTFVFGFLLWSLLDCKYVALIGGDDCCIYLNKSDVVKARQAIHTIANLGLKPEAFEYDNYYSGRFYSGRMLPFKDENGHEVILHTPLPGRCLAKNNCMKFYKNQPVDPKVWLGEVTLGRKFAWGHVPILAPVQRCFSKLFPHLKGRCRNLDTPQIVSDSRRYYSSDHTYYAMSEVYQCGVGDLQALEQYLEDFFLGDFYGKALSSSLLENICEADLK